jgi:hypothetical protein
MPRSASAPPPRRGHEPDARMAVSLDARHDVAAWERIYLHMAYTYWAIQTAGSSIGFPNRSVQNTDQACCPIVARSLDRSILRWKSTSAAPTTQTYATWQWF